MFVALYTKEQGLCEACKKGSGEDKAKSFSPKREFWRLPFQRKSGWRVRKKACQIDALCNSTVDRLIIAFLGELCEGTVKEATYMFMKCCGKNGVGECCDVQARDAHAHFSKLVNAWRTGLTLSWWHCGSERGLLANWFELTLFLHWMVCCVEVGRESAGSLKQKSLRLSSPDGCRYHSCFQSCSAGRSAKPTRFPAAERVASTHFSGAYLSVA